MAAESWSLRGVDRRTREAALTAARKEGITVGEWLNRQVLGEETNGSAKRRLAQDPHHQPDPDNTTDALDRLARRIEAAEHRSTLAITGIDQSVLGLIARLQAAEEGQHEFAAGHETSLESVRETQAALSSRIAKIEESGGGEGVGLDALKSLESALNRVAEQLNENETKSKRRIEEVRSTVDEVSERVDRSVKDVYKRVDTASETVDVQLRRMRDEFETLLQDRLDGKNLAGFEEALGKVTRRLGQAEQLTNNAVRALEATFASLDERVRASEGRIDAMPKQSGVDAKALIAEIEARVDNRVDDLSERVDEIKKSAENGVRDALSKEEGARTKLGAKLEALQESLRSALGRADTAEERVEEVAARVGKVDERLATLSERGDAAAESLEARFEERFAGLGRELSDMVADTRAEIARQLEEAADDPQVDHLDERLTAIQGRVAEAERRHADTLDRIASEVARMAGAVETRLQKTERRAESLVRDRSGYAELDRLLETRLREIEANGAHAISRVGDEVSRMAERLQDQLAATERRSAEAVEDVNERMAELAERIGGEGVGEDIARLMEESEKRTARMVDEALTGARETARDELSPIQLALSRLTDRLEAIEDGAAPAFAPGPPPRTDYEIEPPPFDREAPEASSPAGDAPEEEAPDPRRTNGPFSEPASSAGDPADFGVAEVEPAIDEPAPDAGDDLVEAADLGTDLDDESAEAPPFDDAEEFARQLDLGDESPLRGDADGAPGELLDDEPPPFSAFRAGADYSLLDALDDEGESSIEAKPGFAIENPSAKKRPSGSGSLNKTRQATQGAWITKSDDAPGFGPAAVTAPARLRRGRPLLMAASGLAFIAVGAAFYMLVSDGARRRAIAPSSEGAFDGVLGADESARDRRPPGRAARRAAAPADESAAPASDTSRGGAIAAPAADAPRLPRANGASRANADANAASAASSSEPIVVTSTRSGEPPRSFTVEAAGARSSAAASDAATAAGRTGEYADAAETAEPTIESRAIAPVSAEEAAVASETSGRPTVLQAAAQGDPIAQYQLGMTRLQSGDVEEGVELIRQAAENGLAPAQYRLAKLYENGRGLERDLGEARRWTERAADAGHRNSMHNLGIYYAEGRGAEQDFETASQWFERAARLGARDSQYNLGVLYEQGLGVPLDIENAYVWYSIAARSGDDDAQTRANAVAARLDADALEAARLEIAGFAPQPLEDEANGVFGDLPWERPTLSGEAAVQRAQALLDELGYDPGPADGAAGARTRTAIISYQRDNGLRQTGQVDAALLERLEADAAR